MVDCIFASHHRSIRMSDKYYFLLMESLTHRIDQCIKICLCLCKSRCLIIRIRIFVPVIGAATATLIPCNYCIIFLQIIGKRIGFHRIRACRTAMNPYDYRIIPVFSAHQIVLFLPAQIKISLFLDSIRTMYTALNCVNVSNSNHECHCTKDHSQSNCQNNL